MLVSPGKKNDIFCAPNGVSTQLFKESSLPRLPLSFTFPVAVILAVVMASPTFAQVRRYDVNQATTPPTIDGVVSAGEWDGAAAAAGGWVLLRTADPGDPDGESSRFQMLWDANNLYVLFQSDYGGWNGTAGGTINFSRDHLDLYFDPNTDGEANVNPPDGYQFAINQPQGTTDVANTPIFTEAHVNTNFGNQGATAIAS